MAGIAAAREALGLDPVPVPADTALGAVVAHLQNTTTPDFQPANVTWSFFSPLSEGGKKLDKRTKRGLLAARALAHIDDFAARISPRSWVSVALT
jgi:methylenetetrahydrofolate--tRNA-(uracil-5-)-methyltransferase